MALWKRAVLMLVLVLFAAVAIAPSAGSPRTIPNGVRITGVNVSGLDAGQARQQISARFGSPLRFRFGKRRWTVSTERLGLEVDVEDAVSRALHADSGDDVQVRVEVDRKEVRDYVDALQDRFGFPAEDARIAKLVKGAPVLAPEQWGLAVRRRTMVAGIMRMLKTRIRPAMPLVMMTVKPAITRKNFGPVIVIHRGSNRLGLFKGEKPWRGFRVATGQAQYPTPTGSFRIVDMQRNPWWRPPPDSDWARGAKPIPPGPGNPLGTRWMGLSAPLVGIHGTPDASSIGYSASHGCIRMLIPDATWLFDHVRLGTPVLIVPD
jgi:lipoprotein-anchoring transpeptidase ErfK/SrfK/outer membrane protein assembly factor BamE (lipoprotein component of BamABCDE complex)